MMLMPSRFIIILIALFVTSCSNRIVNKVIGIYSIDQCVYLGYDLSYSFGVNVISFKENGTCNLPPIIPNSFFTSEEEVGKWYFNPEDTTIHIVSKRNILGGVYKVGFTLDQEEKMLQISLYNNNLYLLMSKGMVPYDLEKNKWVK